MKKLESSFLNMALVLTVVAAVSAGLLAWVNHVTTSPISQQAQKTLADGIKAVMGSDGIVVAKTDTVSKEYDGKQFIYVVHYINKEDNAPLGKAVESSVMGFGGEMKVLVGFDESNAILGYKILESAETPGLGQKADTWFQKSGKGNIIGKHMTGNGQLAVSKDGGDVDAITASTITSRAFLKAVNRAFDAYRSDCDTMTGASQKAADARTGASSQVERADGHGANGKSAVCGKKK